MEYFEPPELPGVTAKEPRVIDVSSARWLLLVTGWGESSRGGYGSFEVAVVGGLEQWAAEDVSRLHCCLVVGRNVIADLVMRASRGPSLSSRRLPWRPDSARVFLEEPVPDSFRGLYQGSDLYLIPTSEPVPSPSDSFLKIVLSWDGRGAL